MSLKNTRRVFGSVLDAVGGTPLIRMQRMFPDKIVYLKAEYMNPGGSIKDRIGVYMVL